MRLGPLDAIVLRLWRYTSHKTDTDNTSQCVESEQETDSKPLSFLELQLPDPDHSKGNNQDAESETSRG